MRRTDDVIREAEALLESGKPREAFQLFDLVSASHPEQPKPIAMLAYIHTQQGHYGTALQLASRAAHLAPNDWEVWNLLGVVCRTLGRMEDAAKAYGNAARLNPSAGIYANIAALHVNNGDPEKCLYWADKALELQPDYPHALHHKGMALLEMGRFEKGFPLYEGRLANPGFHHRPYTVPRWDGGRVDCLAIHGEQGLGDEILFLTWLKQLRPRAKRVVIECAKRLHPLLQHSLAGDPDIAVYPSHEALIAAEKPDAYIPMGSLPAIDWKVQPNTYLKPLSLYPRGRQFRVGLSWFGGTIKTHDQLRNTVVEDWRPLANALKASGVDVISLQYGMMGEGAKVLDIPHDQAGIDDFSTLAAMVKSCDLVISVCNTTIHMAGAMGVPCWVLTPDKPAWRYLIEGETVPWYESIKLYRQAKGAQALHLDPSGWKSVLERIQADALALVGTRLLVAA